MNKPITVNRKFRGDYCDEDCLMLGVYGNKADQAYCYLYEWHSDTHREFEDCGVVKRCKPCLEDREVG